MAGEDRSNRPGLRSRRPSCRAGRALVEGDVVPPTTIAGPHHRRKVSTRAPRSTMSAPGVREAARRPDEPDHALDRATPGSEHVRRLNLNDGDPGLHGHRRPVHGARRGSRAGSDAGTRSERRCRAAPGWFRRCHSDDPDGNRFYVIGAQLGDPGRTVGPESGIWRGGGVAASIAASTCRMSASAGRFPAVVARGPDVRTAITDAARMLPRGDASVANVNGGAMMSARAATGSRAADRTHSGDRPAEGKG